jgi:hypothetical protein
MPIVGVTSIGETGMPPADRRGPPFVDLFLILPPPYQPRSVHSSGSRCPTAIRIITPSEMVMIMNADELQMREHIIRM